MQKLYLTFKLIVIGQQGVGKSALLYNYIRGDFKNQYKVTVGVEFCSKNIEKQNLNIQLQLWDTAGQQTYRSVISSFYRGACGIFFIYALDDERSFYRLKTWYKQIKQLINQQACIFLVGNKKDINKRKIEAIQGQQFLKIISGVFFIQTSAKTGQNVQKLFTQTADLMYQKYLNNIQFRELANPNSTTKSIRTESQATSFSLKRPNTQISTRQKCC